jgi:hypothetical protein
MDSRAVFGELKFRAKLLFVLGLLGGIAGGVAWFVWAVGSEQYTIFQYFLMLHALLFEPRFENLRGDFLLAVLAGAVFFTLPAIVFYLRFADPEK